MPYGRNFGFRSFENIVRDGRFRVPASGDPWVIGTAVVVDEDGDKRLRRPTDSETPTQLCGLLVFEHITNRGVDPFLTTPSDFDTVPLNQYAQFVHGIGTKVWFKNTDTKTLYDGRTIESRTLVAGLGATPTVAAGDFLTADTDGTLKEGTSSNGWLVVEQVDATLGLVECRFTF